MNEQNFVACDSRTWTQRLVSRLFPHRLHGRSGFMKRGSGFGLTTTTHAFLDWRDRLRVLCGGIIVVELTTNTENEPGKSESMSVVYVAAPRSIPRGSSP